MGATLRKSPESKGVVLICKPDCLKTLLIDAGVADVEEGGAMYNNSLLRGPNTNQLGPF